MANYHGYFTSLDCRRYEVKITESGDSSAYQEILLAGDQPFVVRYNTSNTPFDPVRTSTATINIVHDDYLHDALSNCAQGTKVELIDITDSAHTSTVWVGYLTPKVYDAGYENCFENFSLEAADCISSLQYIDYVEMSGGTIVGLDGIINQICDATGELEGYYWTRSKRIGTSTLVPSLLSISEHNFQTNDTKEEWKLSEVLEEICQYLGFTCLQYGKRMYFIDYQYLESNADILVTFYNKANNYAASVSTHLDGAFTVTEEAYMSNGATISMEPVYNKVVVNANMYAADDFIPNPFEDSFLTNRIGGSANTYANVEILPVTPATASFPHGGTWYTAGLQQNYKNEESADTQYRYFHRLYDNKYWESVYSQGNSYVTPSDSVLKSPSITRNYRGGTIVDHGVVRKNYKSETQQYIVPSKLDYTRYLCICEKHTNGKGSVYNRTSDDTGAGKVVFRLKDGYKPRVMLDNKCFLVLNCSAIFERYEERNYINPSWVSTESRTNWASAGQWRNAVARPSFRIHIGNKGWSSALNQWVDITNTFYDICRPQMEWDENEKSFWNKEIKILNNVSWEDKVNCEGIKLPLSGIDLTQQISFEVINPDPSFYGNTGNPKFDDKFYDYNSYCWIKDLSLKVVREGESDLGNDSDVVYENEIEECSINELSEIKVRITTQTDEVRPSYSHMIMGSGFLQTVYESAIPSTDPKPLKPEQNIIQKYVHQYSTPTKKITLTLDDGIKPFQKLFGVDVDNLNIGFVQLGTEIDYSMGRQTITAVQKNK